MDERASVPRRGTGLDGWSIAAALGLMAAAFLIERLVPTDEEARPTPAEDIPPQSAPGGTPLLQAWRPKAVTAGVTPLRRRRSRRRDGKTFCGGSMPTSATTAFWRSPPA
jgi:hypothetical protein